MAASPAWSSPAADIFSPSLAKPSKSSSSRRFLGAPILDQDFASGYLRFTDDTADDLLHQLQAANVKPQPDTSALAPWEPVLSRLNSAHSLRIISRKLCSPLRALTFYANLDGVATGPFDVLFDSLRFESFLLGQSRKVADAT